jgi:hypothetical protein
MNKFEYFHLLLPSKSNVIKIKRCPVPDDVDPEESLSAF